jgi:hypothetical protein
VFIFIITLTTGNISELSNMDTLMTSSVYFGILGIIVGPIVPPIVSISWEILSVRSE